ncbi:MAG: hypothetical protein WED33_03925 [Bacteroidia bacterium]
MSKTQLLFVCFFLRLIGNAQTDPCSPPEREIIISENLCVTDLSQKNPNKLERLYFRNFNVNGIDEENLSNSSGSISIKLNSFLKEKITLKRKHSELALSIQDETSFLLIIDSVAEWQADDLRLAFQCKKSKSESIVKSSSSVSLETRKFKKQKWQTDSSGMLNRVPELAFLSPGTLRMQSGLDLQLNENNEIELGLAAAKLTWIRLKSLYTINNLSEIEGVLRNKPYLFQGGLSMQSSFASAKDKTLIWEQTCRIFYPIDKDQSAEMELLNKLSLDLHDGLKTSLVSRYSYKDNRWPPSRWETELRIGYEFSN